MTIKMKPENFIDKILKKFGIKRGIANQENIKKLHDKLGPYVTVNAPKESIFIILKKRLTKIISFFMKCI